MKTLTIIVSALILATLAPLCFVYAGFTEDPWDYELMTRLEVSTDNATWVNYLAEDNSGNQTLTVHPGDTVYFRLKTWNAGGLTATSITLSSTFTNQQYLTNSAMFSSDGGGAGDLDGDTEGYWIGDDGYNAETGVATFFLSRVSDSSTVDTNFQSGGITSTISSNTPIGTVITATVTVSDANPFGIALLKPLLQKAYADEFGTTQVRILVAEATTVQETAPTITSLPATGQDR